MSDKKLVFIGCGNMGQAILAGILSSGVLASGEIGVVEPLDELRAKIGGEFSVDVYADIASSAAADAYILAVKPQQINNIFAPLADAIGDDGALVVSIAAGVSTGLISSKLPANVRVIRTMPNTPMLVGCGCVGVCAGPNAGDADMDFAEKLFSAAAMVHRVRECDMDAVTAVSGSGPAYFFLMMEAMISAGVAEGLTESDACAMAAKTCEGAAKLLASSDVDAAELRRRVTSPGGTTEAAIKHMQSCDFEKIVSDAVKAAASRSRELA